MTFSDKEEAAAAYNTSEAVMNNRFIKVFWHNEKTPVKDRLGANSNPNMVVLGVKQDVEIEEMSGDAEKLKEEKAQAILEIQKTQEMMQSKHEMLKKAEEQRKEALSKQEGLLKSKHVSRRIKVINFYSSDSGFNGWFDRATKSSYHEARKRQRNN